MNTKMSIIVRICQRLYWTFPTISVSRISDGSFIIVLIGSGSMAAPKQCPDQKYKVFMISESDILDRILNREAVLATLFSKAIVLKDELHIMQLIMKSIPNNNYIGRSRYYRGDLEIIFHNVSSPHQFISMTFIPFMEITKTYLSKCPLILSSQVCNGRMDVNVVFFNIKHDFDLIEFKRCLIRRVSELHLHSISICKQNTCQFMADYPIDMLQEVSGQFILLYSDSEDDIDAIIRNIVVLYMNALLEYTDSQTECRVVNRQILDRMLPDSISSISAEFLLHEDIVNAYDGIKKDYFQQFVNNRKILFELVNSSINRYKSIDKTSTKYSDRQKITFLENLYSDIFSASMMHPYYLAFIPFCINEVLKYEI